jgi:rhodanese-related sulfurtransferase
MKKLYIIVAVLLLTGLIISSCTQSSTTTQDHHDQEMPAQMTYTDITPAEAKMMIETNPDLIVIDVSPEYDNGHLPSAVSYPVGDGSLDAVIPMLDKSKPYLVYCHTESASRQGAQKLVDAGFTMVYRLEGEYAAWVDAGYMVEMMNTYTDITPAEAKMMIETNPDLIVIDVSPEYDNGHLPGAVSYPLGDGSLDAAIPMLDKGKPYLVYCHTESASRQGAQKLVDAGFTMVYRLEGEYAAWVDAGYMVEMMNTYTDITPAEAKMMIETNPDLIVIDVSPEYDNGHLPGAVSYPLGDGSLDAAIPMLDKGKPYLVYCHTESASRQGAQKLVDAGFTMVYRLEGEYAAWVDAGYMVEM